MSVIEGPNDPVEIVRFQSILITADVYDHGATDYKCLGECGREFHLNVHVESYPTAYGCYDKYLLRFINPGEFPECVRCLTRLASRARTFSKDYFHRQVRYV